MIVQLFWILSVLNCSVIFSEHNNFQSEYPLLLWQQILNLSCRIRNQNLFPQICKELLNFCSKFHLFLSSFDVFTGTVWEFIDYTSYMYTCMFWSNFIKIPYKPFQMFKALSTGFSSLTKKHSRMCHLTKMYTMHSLLWTFFQSLHILLVVSDLYTRKRKIKLSFYLWHFFQPILLLNLNSRSTSFGQKYGHFSL